MVSKIVKVINFVSNNEKDRTLWTISSLVPDSTTDELVGKRVKLSADDYDSKENFHRDDPQIGVCLECLK